MLCCSVIRKYIRVNPATAANTCSCLIQHKHGLISTDFRKCIAFYFTCTRMYNANTYCFYKRNKNLCISLGFCHLPSLCIISNMYIRIVEGIS